MPICICIVYWCKLWDGIVAQNVAMVSVAVDVKCSSGCIQHWASRCSPHDWAFLECWLHCSCVWLMIMWPQVWILPPLLLIPVVFLVHLVNLKSCVSALPSTVVQTTWLCTPPIWYSWLPQWHSNTPSCLYSHDYLMDTIQKFLIFSFNYKMRLLILLYTS